MDILIIVFEIIGTVAFSVSGAVNAIKKQMDLLGVVFMGLITAVGGGVIRDILLGQIPPRAFLDFIYPLIAIVSAILTFVIIKKHISVKHPSYHEKILFIMDSLGLGVFTVVGIEVSSALFGFNPILNIFMGVLTGVGGGVMRDICSSEIPYIFTKHFYATASIIGAVLDIILWRIFNPYIGLTVGMVSIILLRFFASKFMWNLPKI